MASKGSVAVRILGQEYRIRTDADPAAVARVAALVEDTMSRIRRRTGTVDTLDLAVLAALNLANDLLAARGEGAATGSFEPERLRRLVDSVEGVLREAAARPSA